MTERSATHLVLIPSYNPGPVVYETVRGARGQWEPVWVIVDGSTDGTAAGLAAMARADPGLRVVVLPANRGKGAAVLHGITRGAGRGFHPRAHHGFRRPASGRQHPGVHGGFARRAARP